MSTIVEFLLARIDEREALARAAQAEAAAFDAGRGFTVEWLWALRTSHESGGSGTSFIRSAYPDSPADVLAECQAKRAIVGQVSDVDWGGYAVRDTILGHLAAVYADHPDYDPTWRP